MWKVIDTSNFDNESVPDVLIEAGFSSREAAQALADARNRERGANNSPMWSVVVPETQRLWRGMEELL